MLNYIYYRALHIDQAESIFFSTLPTFNGKETV